MLDLRLEQVCPIWLNLKFNDLYYIRQIRVPRYKKVREVREGWWSLNNFLPFWVGGEWWFGGVGTTGFCSWIWKSTKVYPLGQQILMFSDPEIWSWILLLGIQSLICVASMVLIYPITMVKFKLWNPQQSRSETWRNW